MTGKPSAKQLAEDFLKSTNVGGVQSALMRWSQ